MSTERMARFDRYEVPGSTIAASYRSVDQLTGRVAELEAECGRLRRKHTEDVQLREAACADARTAQRKLVDATLEIASLKAERAELRVRIELLRAEARERDEAAS